MGGATGVAGSSGAGGVGRTDAGPRDVGSADTGSKADVVADVALQNDGPPQSDGAAAADSPASRTTCLGPPSAALANASLPTGYCAWTWASNLNTPRGIIRNASGDMLVVERGGNRISLLHDDNGNGVSDSNERVVLATLSGLNHGIAINGGYLYASTSSTVYRWAYDGGRSALGSSQTVVTGIPSSGHSTRTLLFDGEGRLYVSVGSGSNVDSNSSRARIVRYPASALGSSSTFAQGELFADGLRNEVGLALDGRGRIWGVENGRDELNRTDLGGDIHNDNPGEEVNLFAEPGKFYGYPYCWSEFLLASGMGAGTQWADPQFMNDGTHTDTWCRTTTNVVAPVLVLQAHTAPLDIKFYAGGAFPDDMIGSAIVSNHGSWNRTTPTGYKLVRIPFGADGMPSGEPTTLLEYAGSGDTGSNWPHRPVGIEIGADGRLFVTSDASNIVISIGHDGS